VWSDDRTAPGDEVARLRAVRVLDSSGLVSDAIDRRDPILVDVEYECHDGDGSPAVQLRFVNEEGICLFSSRSTARQHPGRPGPTRIRCRVPGDLFAEGLIRVQTALEREDGGRVHARETEAVAFQVVDGDAAGARPVGDAHATAGVIRPRLEWEAGDPHLGAK
jgi:lipopolysaccharide transport system ATP-binding protein